jgi:hypothetical protein
VLGTAPSSRRDRRATALVEGLERRISSPASYREIYREFVLIFRAALESASDWSVALDAQRTAFNAFCIVDAMVEQALLVPATFARSSKRGSEDSRHSPAAACGRPLAHSRHARPTARC